MGPSIVSAVSAPIQVIHSQSCSVAATPGRRADAMVALRCGRHPSDRWRCGATVLSAQYSGLMFSYHHHRKGAGLYLHGGPA
jgi:hypothetical protein